jgi:hypothetical protein
MADDTPRMLQALLDRIVRETDTFEHREHGKPFLPSDGELFKRVEFEQYCLDIERLLGCDPETLGAPSEARQFATTLFHASWMYIPTAGLFLDSDGMFRALKLKDGHRNWQQTAISDRIREIERALSSESGTISRSSGGTFIQPIQVEFPSLLVLYVTGVTKDAPPRYYTVKVRTLTQAGLDKGTGLQELLDAIAAGDNNAFYSIHYAGFPGDDRLRAFPEEAQAGLETMRARLEQGLHPLQQKDGRRFLEAITLHFQRQWGDRETQLLTRERAQSDVAHELCHDLYDALAMLKNARASVRADDPGTLRSVVAAIECVRAGFATPWLLRHKGKDGNAGPVWVEARAPAQAEIDTLFALFDRKLQIICNGARPLPRSVEVTHELCIDGVPVGAPLVIDLGQPADVSDAAEGEEVIPPVLWPCAYDNSDSIFDREGQRSLLFSPHAELIRNAVAAAEKMDDRAAALGISIRIDVASDGSSINGMVQSGLKRSQGLSGAARKIPLKLAAMSQGLSAKVFLRDGCLVVTWELVL